MNPTLAWVIGAGGLLGSHVLRALSAEASWLVPWNPGPAKVPWDEPSRAMAELGKHVERYSRDVKAGGLSWAVIWCAGAGVVGTTATTLAAETALFEHLLRRIGEHLPGIPGLILLASSAGGVYGNNPTQPLTEESLCQPISDYGRNKLKQERLLLDWASNQPLVSSLTARISNLYGPGQNMDKPQGLIAHISRSLLHHTPVHVYVSLDTVRDYLFAQDCASHLLVCLDRLRLGPPTRVTKIFSAGRTVTIAGLIAAFARIAKGHPRIVCASTSTRTLQPVQLRFQSVIWADLAAPTKTSLPVGIQRVHLHMLSLFQQGRLPPPRLQ